MKYNFEISMIGELNFFLGIQIKHSENEIFISQSKYDRDIVKKFSIEGKSRTRTPMSTSIKISLDFTSKHVDSILYKSMIESLFYITASRPDISFIVSVCARFQSNIKESHVTTFKEILKYLCTTIDYDI
jgi:hypothetical protein